MDFDDLIEDACQIEMESSETEAPQFPAPPDDFEPGFLVSAVASSNQMAPQKDHRAKPVNALPPPHLVRL
jgi:hypothetical protein